MASLSRFRFWKKNKPTYSHSVSDYRKLVKSLLAQNPDDRSLALAQSIGAENMEMFDAIGDRQVAVLRYYGLSNEMNIYDLGCGCGRTAQALQRDGWEGRYVGADVVPELLEELTSRCPGYQTQLNTDISICSPDNHLDIVFHWSVFTHLFPAESYLYTKDAYRALKPGGKMIFSFLELEDSAHDRIWEGNLALLSQGRKGPHLDTFLHRDWIRRFARDAGFVEPHFNDGLDETSHPALWQSVAVMTKPYA